MLLFIEIAIISFAIICFALAIGIGYLYWSRGRYTDKYKKAKV